MISFDEAQKRIATLSVRLCPRKVPLEQALGLVLAETMKSCEPLPAFDNSAVDGWALRGKDLRQAGLSTPVCLEIQGEIAAGKGKPVRLKKGNCFRIFTGAPIPPGADTVVMQEKVQQEKNKALFSLCPAQGENIRRQGEDVQPGDLLLAKGTRLTPLHLTLLAALGVKKVFVYPKPTIGLIVTGSEVIPHTQVPQKGEIRDSVGVLLTSLLQEKGMSCSLFLRVPDQLEKVTKAIKQGLKQELLILTGGISVGEYDFVKDALKKNGVKEIFWKVEMKPGKPIYLGQHARGFVFGLPGNPLSALVGYHCFVLPLLSKLSGLSLENSLPVETAFLENEFSLKRAPATQLLMARRWRNGKEWVRPFFPQGSHRIGQLREANALVFISGEKRTWHRQEAVPVLRLEATHA